MNIAICIPTKRLVSFRWCSALLSLVMKTMEKHTVFLFYSEQFQIDLARTDLVQKVLNMTELYPGKEGPEERPMDMDYLFFLDDDVRCPPYTINLLVSLLEDKPNRKVASGIYPALKLDTKEIFPAVFDFLFDGSITPTRIDPEKMGLVDADMVGLGCCLIKTEVFREITDSWFSYLSVVSGSGSFVHGEDYFFFKQMQKYFPGHKVLVDSSIWCVHEKGIDLNRGHMNGDLFGGLATLDKKEVKLDG